ncbi:hypothetical protein ATC1_13637 [Flexilinea flocculi]|jgi:hypothetical protein|uniref:Uncharacterized protein n=1 Tax=Flexilinea flocculi TaxID=1678840 RepID=A0A0S7BS58_9CHLR|nr:hypothetical protein ATC1_13637 [Flexilinea flocculi]
MLLKLKKQNHNGKDYVLEFKKTSFSLYNKTKIIKRTVQINGN